MISVSSYINNCPVIATDTKLAENIYVPNIAGVRGKKVPRNELAYELGQITISVPSKYIMVTLAAGIFYVNTIRLFFSISKHIGFGTT